MFEVSLHFEVFPHTKHYDTSDKQVVIVDNEDLVGRTGSNLHDTDDNHLDDINAMSEHRSNQTNTVKIDILEKNMEPKVMPYLT